MRTLRGRCAVGRGIGPPPERGRLMIQSLDIRNFKCFKSLHLPELARVNLIGGRNNVGKTSLLEGVYLFHDRMDGRMFLKQFAWRGVEGVRLDPKYFWAPFFHNFDLEEPIGIAVKTENGRSISAEYRFNPQFVLVSPGESGRPVGEGSKAQVSTAPELQPSHAIDIRYTSDTNGETKEHLYVERDRLGIQFEQSPRQPGQAIFLMARGRPSTDEEAARLSEVVESKGVAEVEEFLRIISPGIKDLQLSASYGRPTTCCDVGLKRLVPVAFAGDGLTRLLSIILAMANSQGGIVLIDEIENGIHYSVQKAFWRALSEAARRFECQVIATTHSYEFLRAAHAAFASLLEPDFRYVRLEQDGSETRAVTFDNETLGTAIEADLEVR